jgi:TPP-dependent pyruvate/acetoin dehydrogenase alpha subunit
MAETDPLSVLAEDTPLLSVGERWRLHQGMLRIRRVEEAIARLYPQQEIRCPTHLCTGQEAVPVGTAAHLRKTDYVFSGHRSHGHYLAKGGELRSMIAELYGRESGCAAGRGGSQHLIDLEAGFVASAPILAGTIPIAVGAAFGSVRNGEDRVTVVFFGDAATEEGVFHEALNYASVRKLPIVFVCENNLYSVHSGMDVRQPPGRSIADIGKAHAVPGLTADGNDVEEVWRVARAAIARARIGGGPSLIEFMTYRWMEHCGPNDDLLLGYRTASELYEWRRRCPIARSEAGLRRDRAVDDDALKAAEARIYEEIEAAVTFARQSNFPDASRLTEFTYPAAR